MTDSLSKEMAQEWPTNLPPPLPPSELTCDSLIWLEDDEKTFLEWAHAEMGEHLHSCKLGIGRFDGYRGAKAIEEIKAGDTVIRVPSKMILCAYNLDKSFAGRCPEISAMDPFNQLIFMLLSEKYRTDSYWTYFMRVLPQSYNLATYWSSEELDELQGTSIYKKVVLTKKGLVRFYWRTFYPIFIKHPDSFLATTVEELQWAISTIWSRAFWMDDNDTVPGIVPLADMFNHIPDNVPLARCNFSFNAETQTFNVTINVPLQPGEQVFITYGKKTNSELLCDYGFLVEDNCVDSITIPLEGLPRNRLPLMKEKEAWLKEHKYQPSQFVVDRESGMEDMVIAARLLLFNEKQMNDEVALQRITTKKFIGINNEQMVYSYIVRTADILLSRFHTTLEEDKEILAARKDKVTGKPLTENQRMAIWLRKQERELLADLKSAFEEAIQTLQTQGCSYLRAIGDTEYDPTQHDNEPQEWDTPTADETPSTEVADDPTMTNITHTAPEIDEAELTELIMVHFKDRFTPILDKIASLGMS